MYTLKIDEIDSYGNDESVSNKSVVTRAPFKVIALLYSDSVLRYYYYCYYYRNNSTTYIGQLK